MDGSMVAKYCAIFLAELIGTGLLVFLGCMGCIGQPIYVNSHFQMAFNFGLVIYVIVQGIFAISGAHINPVITTAAVILELISWKESFIYFVAEIGGGIAGYALLMLLVPHDSLHPRGSSSAVCVTLPHESIEPWQAVLIEFIITAMLTLCLCSICDPRNTSHLPDVAFRFGMVIGCMCITAGAFTGGSMNPARSLGPALMNNEWQDHWIYWVGPLSGGIVTSVGYRFFWGQDFG